MPHGVALCIVVGELKNVTPQVKDMGTQGLGAAGMTEVE